MAADEELAAKFIDPNNGNFFNASYFSLEALSKIDGPKKTKRGNLLPILNPDPQQRIYFRAIEPALRAVQMRRTVRQP